MRGIDIRESGALLFRTLLQDSDGAIVPSGNTQLRLYELQNDGRLFQYDFTTLLFSSGVIANPSGLMTQRKSEISNDNFIGGKDTGIWTYLLPHSSGFREGKIYLARSTNSSASPADQYREFQWADGVLANVVKINDGNPIQVIGSSVWTANTTLYNTGFGAQLQPVYYADIKQYFDVANNRDEYGVQWFNGITPVNSGQLTDPAISVYRTTNGTAVFQDSVMSYASPTLGMTRYNSSVLLSSGEPYLAVVSGIVDGGSRQWQKIIGRNSL